MKTIIYLSLILLFLGCNAKQKVGYFDNQKNQQQAIIYTKKAQFSINNKRYLLTGTYLNPIKSLRIKDNENFLISIYSSDLTKENILTGAMLNGKIENVSWQMLSSDDNLTSFSPVYNKWNSYYLLHAPISKIENLKLTLQIHKTKKVVLDFEKSLLN